MQSRVQELRASSLCNHVHRIAHCPIDPRGQLASAKRGASAKTCASAKIHNVASNHAALREILIDAGSETERAIHRLGSKLHRLRNATPAAISSVSSSASRLSLPRIHYAGNRHQRRIEPLIDRSDGERTTRRIASSAAVPSSRIGRWAAAVIAGGPNVRRRVGHKPKARASRSRLAGSSSRGGSNNPGASNNRNASSSPGVLNPRRGLPLPRPGPITATSAARRTTDGPAIAPGGREFSSNADRDTHDVSRCFTGGPLPLTGVRWPASRLARMVSRRSSASARSLI